ncbi:MAG: MBL fold metallo-hydrolase, partial [Vallitaleaceae bacterium]|nr:MBL fold metallo-hydrolase [Vallitaleaceae bacterium]
MKNIKIWYLDHSSFAVKVKNKVLIFDYHNDQEFNGKKGFEGGVIRPEELKGLDVFVFVSHSHNDHYNPIIHSWEKEARKITYIFSSDVEEKDTHKVHLVEPHKEYDFHGIHIKTLLSNDMGVAFYVTIEGLHFFHSGDLNWWRWPQESKEWNDGMEK